MAEPIFINPFTDFGFKKIFGEEQNKEDLKYYNDLKNSLDTAHQEGYLEAQARYEMELEDERKQKEEERKQKEEVQQQMNVLQQQLIDTIQNMHNLGLSTEQIALATNRPIAEIEEILSK